MLIDDYETKKDKEFADKQHQNLLKRFSIAEEDPKRRSSSPLEKFMKPVPSTYRTPPVAKHIPYIDGSSSKQSSPDMYRSKKFSSLNILNSDSPKVFYNH